MRDLIEALQWLAADMLCRRVRRRQIRKFLLQIAQFTQEAVELPITYDWRGLSVITAVVFFDRKPELLDSGARSGFGFGHGRMIRTCHLLPTVEKNLWRKINHRRHLAVVRRGGVLP